MAIDSIKYIAITSGYFGVKSSVPSLSPAPPPIELGFFVWFNANFTWN